MEWKLYIIDDKSKDNSIEIINKYSCLDNRIFSIKHDQNRGVSAARNSGLLIAKEEYVAFIDSDDTWYHNKLEKQIAFMLDNNLTATFTGIDHINDLDEVLDNWENINNKYPDTVVDDSRLFKKRNIIVGGGSTVIITKNIFSRNYWTI